MKQQLNEVQRLQKIAGILKEAKSNEPSIHQVVQQLNKIANSKGFFAVDKSPDVKGISSGRYNLVKWENDDEKTVELYSDVKGPEATSDDLGIEYYLKNGQRMVGPALPWLKPDTWDFYFNNDNDNEEDPLYNELVNQIGEKTLQKLFDQGWDIDDIAEDPQGAAASLKRK